MEMSNDPLAGIVRAVPSQDVIEPEEIRKARHELRMTQERFAAALGVPLGTLQNWEQGLQACANPSLLRHRIRCLREHESV